MRPRRRGPRAGLPDCALSAQKDVLLVQKAEPELAWAAAAAAQTRTGALAAAGASLAALSPVGRAAPAAQRLKLELALATSDAAAALDGWRGYFWLSDHNAPASFGLSDQAVSDYLRRRTGTGARPRSGDRAGAALGPRRLPGGGAALRRRSPPCGPRRRRGGLSPGRRLPAVPRPVRRRHADLRPRLCPRSRGRGRLSQRREQDLRRRRNRARRRAPAKALGARVRPAPGSRARPAGWRACTWVTWSTTSPTTSFSTAAAARCASSPSTTWSPTASRAGCGTEAGGHGRLERAWQQRDRAGAPSLYLHAARRPGQPRSGGRGPPRANPGGGRSPRSRRAEDRPGRLSAGIAAAPE